MKGPVAVTPSVQIRHLGGWRYRVRLVLGVDGFPSFDEGVRWGRKRAERYGRKVLAEEVGRHSVPPAVTTITPEEL